MAMVDDIKAYALDIGYTRVGITAADAFTDHMEEVRSRKAVYDFYVQDQRGFMAGAKPQKAMPGAKSIISLVWDYAQKAFPDSLLGKIGRIYQARCYGPPPHRINGARYRLMVEFLRKMGCGVGSGFFLPERRTAARAGCVTFGKNNFAYARGSGSFVVLSSIVVDKALEPDAPTMTVACPKDCRACMDACPTGAIYAPLKLDPRRCIAFNNWWTQDGRPPNITGVIPYDIRDKMGTRVHGCDVCQESCPRNQFRINDKLPEDPFLVEISRDFSLVAMLRLTDDFYRKSVMPLMYNYISEKKYFRRNAVIALGNTKDPAFVPDLAAALSDAQELVRGHAAWALGHIGTAAAKRKLSTALGAEPSPWVRNEIRLALTGGANVISF